MAGDGLLSAVSDGVADARDPAARCAALLRERSNSGDEDRLEVAIAGRGAFRRFKDVLARWPGELERWHLFSNERGRGRARAWLAREGYRPSVRAKP